LRSSYGLLAGPAFSISNACAGIWFGKVADNTNRSKLLAFMAIAWSMTTIITGSVNSLAVMAMMRFGLGLFQAACEPLIFSLINDTIPKDKVPFANSIVKAAPYAGSALSSLNVIAIATLGWRGCCLGMGMTGIFVGLLALLTTKEPTRGALEAE
jgi:MFS family permease